MRVLVTGGGGFVGSYLVARLVEVGHEVAVVEHVTCHRSSVPARVPLYTGDYGKRPQEIGAVLREFSPKIVIHLAAIVRATPETEWIEPLVQTNILFGTRLLQESVDRGVSRFIAAGSYWQSQYNAREYSPVNLYAATKQAFSDIAKYYAAAYSMTTTVLKLFGNYGPEDRRSNLFSALRLAAGAKDPVAMSEGHQEVDLIHISDICRAFLAAISAEDLPQYSEFEVGTGSTASIRQIAKWYEEGVGKPLNLKWGGRPQPTHHERAAAIEHTQRNLGWNPTVAMRKGIKALGESHRGA